MHTEDTEEAFDWASHLKAYLSTDEETNIEIAFQFLTSLGLPDDVELYELLRSSDMKICYCLRHDMLAPILDITKLDLHTWNLEEILPKLPLLKRLEELNLAECAIKSLPRDFAELEHLQVLNLAFNRLTELPQDFKRLVELTDLDLECNPLTALPDGFWELSKLKNLSLEDTKLTSITGIHLLEALEELDLRDSQIAIIPEEIGKLSQLKILKVARCPIKSLPATIAQLQNLELLYIGDIEGLQLPEWIVELPNLKELSLSKSQISDVLEAKLRQAMPTLEIKF